MLINCFYFHKEFEAMLEVADEAHLRQKPAIKEETEKEESSHDLTDVSESTVG